MSEPKHFCGHCKCWDTAVIVEYNGFRFLECNLCKHKTSFFLNLVDLNGSPIFTIIKPHEEIDVEKMKALSDRAKEFGKRCSEIRLEANREPQFPTKNQLIEDIYFTADEENN